MNNIQAIKTFEKALTLRADLLLLVRKTLQQRYPKAFQKDEKGWHKFVMDQLPNPRNTDIRWAIGKIRRGYFGTDCSDQNLLRILHILFPTSKTK